MPVGDIQCSMVFTEKMTGKSLGWSEEHFHMTAADLATARDDLYSLARARVALLGVGVELIGLKATDVTVWRDSRLGVPFIPRVVGGLPVYNASFRTLDTWVADFAYSSLLVRLDSMSAPLYRRSHWISGNPDQAQDILARDPTGNAPWNRAWQVYRDLLTPPRGAAGLWGFRVKSRDPATTFETEIDDIDEQTGAFLFVNLPAAFAPGRYVVVRNVRGLTPRIAGTYLITTRGVAAGAQVITLDHVGTAAGGEAFEGEYTGTGLIRLLVPITVGYKSTTLRRFGRKNVGGPSDRARGKRKTRIPVI